MSEKLLRILSASIFFTVGGYLMFLGYVLAGMNGATGIALLAKLLLTEIVLIFIVGLVCLALGARQLLKN